ENQGNYELALQDYEAVIRLAPGQARGYVNRGNVLSSLNDNYRALSDYERALELDQDNSLGNRKLAYRGRAEAYLELGDEYTSRRLADKALDAYQKAFADFEEALRCDPNDLLTYWYRGAALRALESYDKATKDFAIVLDLVGDADRSLAATLHAEKGK